MTNKTFLPTTATPLEKKLTKANETLPPIPLRSLWSATNCPANLLPYLAWQYSVDRWSANWNEETKRKVICEAFEIHKIKGTKEALRRAVEPFGYLIRISEWWQTDKPAGTFSIEIGVLDKGITEESYQELSRIIDEVKPLSRHLTGLIITLDSKGKTKIGSAMFHDDILTVHPYTPEQITTQTLNPIGIGLHIIDTLKVTA